MGVRIVCLFVLLFAGSAVSMQQEIQSKPVKKAHIYLHKEIVSQVGSLDFRRCKLRDPVSQRSRIAECALLTVPEDYGQPNDKQIELFVARFKSSAAQKKDAMVLLAGGPGQAASEAFINWGGYLRKVLRQRDIYLMDQRGTGSSNKLACGQIEQQPRAVDAQESRAIAEKCLQQLPGDPRFYTTSVAVKDLDALRQALGLDAWNLYGLSYGTRVAQHYLRRYPDSTRTVILDGVVHPQLALGPAVALESQRALEQMMTRCAQSEDCKKHYPDFQAGIARLIKKLKKAPQKITIENFKSGKLETLEFSMAHLAAVMRLSLYTPATISLLPVMLHEAYANQNYAPLARQALFLINGLNLSISPGMHNAVVCTEDFPYFENEHINTAQLKASYMGSELLDSVKAVCEIWPKGIIDENFKMPVVSDKPVLLLSGSVDPITPPEYATKAAVSLSNSHHIIVPEQGHGQATLGCMPTIIAKFVSDASVDKLKTDCLDKQKPEPFFIDFNGPQS